MYQVWYFIFLSLYLFCGLGEEEKNSHILTEYTRYMCSFMTSNRGFPSRNIFFFKKKRGYWGKVADLDEKPRKNG